MAGLLSAALKSGAGKDLVKELNKRLAPAVGKYSVRCGICSGTLRKICIGPSMEIKFTCRTL